MPLYYGWYFRLAHTGTLEGNTTVSQLPRCRQRKVPPGPDNRASKQPKIVSSLVKQRNNYTFYPYLNPANSRFSKSEAIRSAMQAPSSATLPRPPPIAPITATAMAEAVTRSSSLAYLKHCNIHKKNAHTHIAVMFVSTRSTSSAYYSNTNHAPTLCTHAIKHNEQTPGPPLPSVYKRDAWSMVK